MTLAWLADLLGLPAGLHGHLEDTASTGLVTALAAARAAAPGRRVVVCSEHTHSSTAKAARLLELELRDGARRRRRTRCAPSSVDLTDACARRRDDRDDVVGGDRPGAALADRCAAGGRLAPRRRRLRGRARPSARSCGRCSPAGSAPTRSASTRTSGSSRRWTARRSSRAGPDGAARRVQPRARVPPGRARTSSA